MSNNEKNAFDELGKSEKTPSNPQADKLNHLIHKTFVQSEAGAELLDIWTIKGLVMSPTAEQGMDLLEIGIREGRKSFIRDLILTIKHVEDNQ